MVFRVFFSEFLLQATTRLRSHELVQQCLRSTTIYSGKMATEPEAQHLLAHEERANSRDVLSSNTSIPRKLPSKRVWVKHLRFYVLIFTLQFITNFSFYLYDLPYVRLFERKICQVHYGSTDDIAEERCKLPDIQNRLAFILELMNTFNAIPSRYQRLHGRMNSN